MDSRAVLKSNRCGKLALAVQEMREFQQYWCRDTQRGFETNKRVISHRTSLWLGLEVTPRNYPGQSPWFIQGRLQVCLYNLHNLSEKTLPVLCHSPSKEVWVFHAAGQLFHTHVPFTSSTDALKVLWSQQNLGCGGNRSIYRCWATATSAPHFSEVSNASSDRFCAQGPECPALAAREKFRVSEFGLYSTWWMTVRKRP